MQSALTPGLTLVSIPLDGDEDLHGAFLHLKESLVHTCWRPPSLRFTLERQAAGPR